MAENGLKSFVPDGHRKVIHFQFFRFLQDHGVLKPRNGRNPETLWQRDVTTCLCLRQNCLPLTNPDRP